MEYDKKTFPIRAKADFYVHGTQPADKVLRISKALRDAAPDIEKAGNAYVDAGSMLAGCLRRIEDAADRMAKVWGDKASIEAQLALKALHKAIDEVSDRFNSMGRPLESLGRDVLPKYADSGGWDGWGDHPTPIQGMKFLWYDNGAGGGTSWFASANDVATKHLQRLNHDLEMWYNLLPSDVSRTLPKIDDSAPSDLGLDKPPPSGPGNNGGGGFDPTGGGGSPGGPTVPGGGQHGDIGGAPGEVGADDPGAITTPTTSPQTTPNTPDMDQPDLPKVPDPNADLAGKGSDLSSPAPRDTTLADFQRPRLDMPTSTNTTPYSPSYAQTGMPAGGASTGMGGAGYTGPLGAGSGAGDAAGRGMPPMYPPMGPAGRQTEEGSDGSTTWLHEDDDVWGGPADGTTNHTIHHDMA